jgi:nicotinate-nucleotide adenylyltransferase
VALALAALEQLPIEKLIVLVEERPGHRDVVADADARLRMARAAFEGLGPVEVVPDPNPFTVDTVRGGRFGDALFVVGADQGGAFDTWKDPEEVLRWVKLAVGTRAGHPQPKFASELDDRVRFFTLDSPPVSSTTVRERVAAGEPIDDLVPAGVAQVIEEEGLYR